jgi:hypothetical protein
MIFKHMQVRRADQSETFDTCEMMNVRRATSPAVTFRDTEMTRKCGKTIKMLYKGEFK